MSAIVIVKFITKWSLGRKEHIQNEIGNIIETYLFNDKPIDNVIVPKDASQFRNLVETLERYDQRFTDPRWIEIKEKIVGTYLLPFADTYAESWFWTKRQLAARALLLCPNKANEKLLRKLLDDPRYLVRVAAAVCITQTPYKDLFLEVIRKMSKETALSQFPYRDALIQIDQEKFHWMESLLKTESNKAVIAICLDVLSMRYSNNLLPLVKPFVNDPDRNCRILAIRTLGNIPNAESIDLLMDHLIDSDWEIRAEAIIGLQKLYATQAIPKLRILLNDPIWWVRLQAALTLKNFGKEGREILTSLNSAKEPLAFEISQYTLALP